MQLLVSVRSAAEVGPALAGGADIIDAKEPARGSLGPVAPATLAEIMAGVPAERPFSVALGDVASPKEVIAVIASQALPVRPGPTYLKLGFAGVRSPEMVTRLLATAVGTLATRSSAALVVAVAYADAGRAESLPPELMPGCAHRAGAAGVLLDTHIKDGIGLLGWLAPEMLAAWVASAQHESLLTALAGALRLEDVDAVAATGADVVGVRGAACEGGRQGHITTKRVRLLRQQLTLSASIPRPIPPTRSQGGWRNAG